MKEPEKLVASVSKSELEGTGIEFFKKNRESLPDNVDYLMRV